MAVETSYSDSPSMPIGGGAAETHVYPILILTVCQVYLKRECEASSRGTTLACQCGETCSPTKNKVTKVKVSPWGNEAQISELEHIKTEADSTLVEDWRTLFANLNKLLNFG
ncbi:hypothetical protein V8E53_015529 [Lactarius tabidus]